MSHHTRRTFLFTTATLMLLVGCGSGDPPKLTGAYSLESVQSAEWTGGNTLTPPAATGVLLMSQARFDPGLAYGHAQLELTHSSGASSRWTGSYTNDAGGMLSMRLNDVRFEGQYDFGDDVLTMELAGEHSETGPPPWGHSPGGWNRKSPECRADAGRQLTLLRLAPPPPSPYYVRE